MSARISTEAGELIPVRYSVDVTKLVDKIVAKLAASSSASNATRSSVIRAAVDAGIAAVAHAAGIGDSGPRRAPPRGRKLHPDSVKRAQARAAARAAAGCVCPNATHRAGCPLRKAATPLPTEVIGSLSGDGAAS